MSTSTHRPDTSLGDGIAGTDIPSATAIALAPMVEVWQRLLTEHVPDRHGRCMSCQWQTRSADLWPCGVFSVASAAQRAAQHAQQPGRAQLRGL